jgi:replicative DNA helicase
MNQALKTKLENIISQQHHDEAETLTQLKNLIYETEFRNSLEFETKSITQLVTENIKQIKGEQPRNNTIKTGFTDFDTLIGGLSLGEFVVIGARPAMGKTQLLVNLALNIADTIPVLYLTFDLPAYALTTRFISCLSGIPNSTFIQNKLTDREQEKLLAAETELIKRKIYVNETCHNSISAIKAHCLKQINDKGVKVVFIDFLQMMSSYKYRYSRELEISYLCRELKNMAREFNVCVIVASQLNRAVEYRTSSRQPMLSDLRESGTIEQEADKVIFLYRPEYYKITCDEDGNNTEGVAKLIVAKNRTGRLEDVKLLIDKDFTRYRDFTHYQNDFDFADDRLNELFSEKPDNNTSTPN